MELFLSLKRSTFLSDIIFFLPKELSLQFLYCRSASSVWLKTFSFCFLLLWYIFLAWNSSLASLCHRDILYLLDYVVSKEKSALVIVAFSPRLLLRFYLWYLTVKIWSVWVCVCVCVFNPAWHSLRFLDLLVWCPSLFWKFTAIISCSFSFAPSSSFWESNYTYAFVVVQLLGCIQLFTTPWIAAQQASLSFTISRS